MEKRIRLKTKYYTGMQIFDVLSSCLDDAHKISEIMQRFADMPSADTAEWIPVRESMPSEDGTYLVTFEWSGRTGTKYIEIEGIDFEHGRWACRDYETVTAWMPLPKPYDERNE